MDCKELVAGSTLFVPVTVEGAYLFLGDGHAARGDGEVGGSAVECGMTTTPDLLLLDEAPVASVHAVTPSAHITFRLSADLNEASGDALAAMLDWTQLLLQLAQPSALAFASAIVDLRVTQIANQTWGVHTARPHRALTDRDLTPDEGRS